MAENKKSVVLYIDIITTFEALTDEEAGKLIKHYLRYVNDQNPVAPDRITEIAFEPIKQQLKRDLIKWEEKSTKLSETGRIGGLRSAEKRSEKKQNQANGSEAKQMVEKSKQIQHVTDSVIVNVIDNNTPAFADFSLLNLNDIIAITSFIKKNKPSFPEPYIALWNLFAEKYGKAKVKKTTPSRKAKIAKRIKESGFDYPAILSNAKNWKFAMDNDWFTFDYTIESEKNYTKILEYTPPRTSTEQTEEQIKRNVNRELGTYEKEYGG